MYNLLYVFKQFFVSIYSIKDIDCQPNMPTSSCARQRFNLFRISSMAKSFSRTLYSKVEFLPKNGRIELMLISTFSVPKYELFKCRLLSIGAQANKNLCAWTLDQLNIFLGNS